MTTTTLPRIIRFTASRDNECGSPWRCEGVKAGAPSAYVGGAEGSSTTPHCGSCADRVEAGERPGSARPVLARTVDIVEPGQPGAPTTEVGEIGTLTKLAIKPAPDVEPERPAEPELEDRSPADPDRPAPAPAGPLRVLVTGSRDWTDRAAIEAALVDAVGVALDVVVVHGDARGADSIAADVARVNGWAVEAHPADWDGEGKAAGVLRNGRMVALGADVCVAFPIGESRGTRDCMARVTAADIALRVVEQPASVTLPNPRGYPDEVVQELAEWQAGGGAPAERQAVEHLVAAGIVAREAVPPIPTPLAAVDTDDAMPLPDLSVYAGDAIARDSDPELVGAELIEAFRLGILAGDIRGRQIEIGPSEVGHPCSRALAYRLAGTPHTGTQATPWRQAVGTALHERGELWAHEDNERRGVRWLTNLRVSVGELYPGREIRGTLDYLDIPTATILDGKNPGSTAMKKYGRGKPESEQYRKQVQLYGRGVLRAGFLPEWVGVLRVSPARELAESVWKYERFDEQVAVAALTRAGGIARMVDAMGARAATVLPPTDFNCHRCDWFRPGSNDLAIGCPGAPGAVQPRRASVDDLVA